MCETHMHMRIAMPHPLEKYPPHHLPSLYLLISQRPVGSTNFKEMVLLFWIPLLLSYFGWWVCLRLENLWLFFVNCLLVEELRIWCPEVFITLWFHHFMHLGHKTSLLFFFPVFLGIKFGCELWLDAYPKTSLTALLDFILLDQPSVGFIGGTLILLSVFEPYMHLHSKFTFLR